MFQQIHRFLTVLDFKRQLAIIKKLIREGLEHYETLPKKVWEGRGRYYTAEVMEYVDTRLK